VALSACLSGILQVSFREFPETATQTRVSKGSSLLKKSLSDHSVVQDSAKIPENKTKKLQMRGFLALERAQKTARRSFSTSWVLFETP
jgi:hypothetical protein